MFYFFDKNNMIGALLRFVQSNIYTTYLHTYIYTLYMYESNLIYPIFYSSHLDLKRIYPKIYLISSVTRVILDWIEKDRGSNTKKLLKN